MAETDKDDTAFTAMLLDALPRVEASPALSRAIMAAYDTIQTRRRRRFGAALRRFSDIVWPGAPAWAPGSLLAAALIAGLGIGAALPYPSSGGGFSLDEPSSFSLFAANPAESL